MSGFTLVKPLKLIGKYRAMAGGHACEAVSCLVGGYSHGLLGAVMKLPHKHDENIENILERMPEPEFFADASSVFQQLCDGSRLRILWLLCHCEECGINIAAAVGMSNAAVSHHLKLLKLHGLITSRRSGKEVYYTLASTETAELIHKTIDNFFNMSCPGKSKP